jgi:protein-S-isoprenylcysteine O-methyltransferase Ste14
MGVLELALLLLGMLFIRREIWQLHAQAFDVTTWQVGLLIPLAVLDGSLTGLATASNGTGKPEEDSEQHTPAYKGTLRWGKPLFFFLYVGVCALCERLSARIPYAVFPTSAGFVVRTIGIALVVCGILLRLAAYRSKPLEGGPYQKLRHPDAAGKLLSLFGLPFVFNAWLPLLALPGVLVLLKWHIADLEAFRISQLGEPYLEYRKKTWNLIPYLY